MAAFARHRSQINSSLHVRPQCGDLRLHWQLSITFITCSNKIHHHFRRSKQEKIKIEELFPPNRAL